MELKSIKKKSTYSDGPCVLVLDEILNEVNVQRQAYHGKSFVGNHVHKMLKVYIQIVILKSVTYVYFDVMDLSA